MPRISPTKKLKSKTWHSFLLETRFSESFENLMNSSLAQSVGKLWSCKVVRKYGIYR